MNSMIKYGSREMTLFQKALAVGLPVYLHTFHDGPDSYERIVLRTANTKRLPDNSPLWRWSDEADLSALLDQIRQIDPSFNPND